MEMSVQDDSGIQIVTHFHTFFFTFSHTLHTLFTQSEPLWPNMAQSYHFCVYKYVLWLGNPNVSNLATDMGSRPSKERRRPQEPPARARNVAAKRPCILVFQILVL